MQGLYLIFKALLEFSHAFQVPQSHGVAQDAMAEAAPHSIRVLASHVVEIVVDVFLLLETVALLEEVRVVDHLDETTAQQAQGVKQGFEQELVGD